MAFVQNICNAFLEPLSDEVAWIMSLKSKLNPYSVKPTECMSMVITHGWRDILRSFVIKDLRANLLGKRNHLWAGKNCMIVFFLTSDPLLLESKGFYSMSTAEIEASDAFGFIDNYVHSATWIFCPQTSGPCSQATHVTQTAAYARKGTSAPSAWDKRKPRLTLSDMYSAPTSPASASVSASSDTSSIHSDNSSSSAASNSTSPSTSISISCSPDSSFALASPLKKDMLTATTAAVFEHRISHLLYDKPRRPQWRPTLRPALRSGGNRLTSFGTVSDDMDHNDDDDDDEDYYGEPEPEGDNSLDDIRIVPYGESIYQPPSFEYHALAPHRSWTGGQAFAKGRDDEFCLLSADNYNDDDHVSLDEEAFLESTLRPSRKFALVENGALKHTPSSAPRKAKETVSNLVKKLATITMRKIPQYN